MPESTGQDGGSAVNRLSGGQLACLRFVSDGLSSKQIAKELGISPHTVDQRLRLAMQTLGVDSRFAAARLVRHAESGGYQSPAYQPVHQTAYQSPHVAGPAGRGIAEPVSGDADDVRRYDAHGVVGEARPGFEPLPTGFSLPSSPPASRGGTRRNDLAPIVRMAWTIGLTIGVVLALSLLITAAEGLARILQAFQP